MKKFSIVPFPTSRRTVVDLLMIVSTNCPPGYLVCDVDMTWAYALKSRLFRLGHKVTVTAIWLKAIGIAQQNHPLSRTEILPFGRAVTYQDIVAGFTVEREVNNQPTVFFGEIDCPHLKSIPTIAGELKNYSQNAISSIPPLVRQTIFSRLPSLLRKMILGVGKRFPALRLTCQRATFGLTTLGKYGITFLLSPCVCTSTFGLGSVEDRPVAVDGRIDIRPIMTISFNYDQRAIDAPSAARFLQEVRMLVEGGMEGWIEEEGSGVETSC